MLAPLLPLLRPLLLLHPPLRMVLVAIPLAPLLLDLRWAGLVWGWRQEPMQCPTDEEGRSSSWLVEAVVPSLVPVECQCRA